MSKPPPSSQSRRIVPDRRWRDALIAVAVGLAILGVILYAVFDFSVETSASGRVEGVIVAKHFVAAAEEQITVGRNGLNTKKIDGEYSFDVRMPQEDGKIYKVLVGKQDYGTRQVGEQFSFYRQ